MERLGKFALAMFVLIGRIGYAIVSIIWYIASTLVCALAALLATPMALITRSNKCLLAILGVWVIAIAVPAKLVGMEKFDWNDYSPKIANKLREKGVSTTADANDNINRSMKLIKDYWNDGES